MTLRPPENQQAPAPLSEFYNALDDFTAYLNQIRLKGVTFTGESEQTKEIIAGWPDSITHSSDFNSSGSNSSGFKFSGPDNASIFVIDGESTFYKGEPGALLTKILKAMGMDKDSVFICSSRQREPIAQKIESARPKVVITLGQNAAQLVLETSAPLEDLCGRFHDMQGVKVMPAYHPSQLLLNPQLKRQVWEDMKRVMAYTGLGKAAG